MSLVEDQEIDLVDRDERAHEAVVEDVCGADDGLVLGQVLLPDLLVPEVATQVSPESVDGLIEIALQHGILLEDESDAVDEKEGNAWRASGSSALKFLVQHVSQQQHGDQSLARA